MQALRKGPSNRHGLTNRAHRRCQNSLAAREFLKGKTRNFRHDIINGRLKGGRGRACDIIIKFVQRIANRKLGRDFRNREARRFGRQSGGARHARVHLNDDHTAIFRVHAELHIGPACLDADFAQNRNRGIAHDLIFFICQRQRGRDGDGVARMDAHRVDIFNRADDDAIIRFVADNFHLIFFPPDEALIDEHFIGGRRGKPGADNFFKLFEVIGDAAACAAHGEGRTNNRGQSCIGKFTHRFRYAFSDIDCAVRHGRRGNHCRARVFQPNLGHGGCKALARFGLIDHIGFRANHLDAMFFKNAHLLQGQRRVQRRLPAHRREQRVWLFNRNNFFDNFRRDRLDIGRIRHARVCHNCSRVRVHENDAITFIPKRLTGLHARIIKLTGLADNDRSSPDDKDGRNIGTFWH